MEGRAPNRIAELRKARGWTQEQLARACEPPTTQPQIKRLETGERRLTQQWMDILARALKVDAADLLPTKPQGETRPGKHPQQSVEPETSGRVEFARETRGLAEYPRTVKILGHVRAGVDGVFLDQGEIQGMAPRPPALNGVKSAFAAYVRDDSMFPAFEPDDIVYVNPALPVVPGVNVIVELSDGQAFIKRLVRRTEKHVICMQWNPNEEIKYDAKKVKALYRILRPREWGI